MKKVLFITALALITLLIACSSSEKIKSAPVKTGWINPDTLIVSGTGHPAGNESSKTHRRIRAREKAILNAQNKICSEALGSSCDKYMAAIEKMYKNFPGGDFDHFFIGGSIITMDYDDNDICTILFRLQRKNLRKNADEIRELYK